MPLNESAMGKVVKVHKCWWLKVNTKPVRAHSFDGALFPHILTVEYSVDGKIYKKRKWVPYDQPAPSVGDTVEVFYHKDAPAKCEIHIR
ncbi:MAG: sugar ABC transporter permease [Clostridiales bacterium]|nr:sugar ABC transporter permease [Clostridiales bacterium]